MAELAPFQKQTLAIKGKNPLKTYSLRLGYLNHILDKAGIESDQDRQKLIEVTLGQKPEDVDMSDTVWGEVKRRVQSGVLQLTTMPLKFAQFANAFGDADWEDIEDYEKQITSLERRAQSVPKMREGYLYDVVEQVPNTLSTLGVTLGVSAVTGGFAFPALASYGINIIFETGESFNAKLRDQKIDRAFASKWKGKIPEREYQENLREAKKDAALSAGSVQIALEAINPFNAVEALPMGKIGTNIVGKLAKTQSAKFGPTRALRAKIQDSPRLSKAIGVGGETVARSATEFGQEFTQNVKGDVIQQVVGTDKEVGDALGDVDYGSASYGALVAAGSAGGVTATTNVAKRVISEEAPTTSESELIRERVRQAIESGDGQRLAEELSVLRQEVAEEEEQNRQNKESVSEWRDKWRIRLAPDFLNKRQKLKKQLQIAEEEINDIANGRETDSRVDKDRTRFELRKGLSQAVENGSQKEVDQWLNVNSDNPHAKVIIDDFVKDVESAGRYSLRDVFRARDLGVQPDTRPPEGPPFPDLFPSEQEGEATAPVIPTATPEGPTLRQRVEEARGLSEIERDASERLETRRMLEDSIARLDRLDDQTEADVSIRNQLDASLRQLNEIEAQKEVERRADPTRQTTEEALEDAQRPEPRRTEESVDMMPTGVSKVGENKKGEDLFEDAEGVRYRVGVDKEGNLQHYKEPDWTGFEESDITDKSLDRRQRKRTQDIENYSTVQESAEQRGEPTMIESVMQRGGATTPTLDVEGRQTGEAEITDEARQLLEGTTEPTTTDEETTTDTTEQVEEEEKPTLTLDSATKEILDAPELEGMFKNKSQALKRLREEIKKGEGGVVSQVGKRGKTIRKGDIEKLISILQNERPQVDVKTEAEIEQQVEEVDEKPTESVDEKVEEKPQEEVVEGVKEEERGVQRPTTPEEPVVTTEQTPQSNQELVEELNDYVVENYSNIFSNEPVYSGEGKARKISGLNIFSEEKKKGRKIKDKKIERRFTRDELEQVGAINQSEEYGEFFDVSKINKIEKKKQDAPIETQTVVEQPQEPVPETHLVEEEAEQQVPEGTPETDLHDENVRVPVESLYSRNKERGEDLMDTYQDGMNWQDYRDDLEEQKQEQFDNAGSNKDVTDSDISNQLDKRATKNFEKALNKLNKQKGEEQVVEPPAVEEKPTTSPVTIEPPSELQDIFRPLWDGDKPSHPAFGKSEGRKALGSQSQETLKKLKDDADFDISTPNDLTTVSLIPFKDKGQKISYLIYPKDSIPLSPEQQKELEARTENNPVTPQDLAKLKLKLRVKDTVDSQPIRKISSDIAERLTEVADSAGVKLGEYKPIMSEEVATAFKEINEEFGEGADTRFVAYTIREETTPEEDNTLPLSRVVADLNRRGRVVTEEKENSGEVVPYKTTLYMPASGKGKAEIDIIGKETKNSERATMYTIVVPADEAHKVFQSLAQTDEDGGRARKWRASAKVLRKPSHETLSANTSTAKQGTEGNITGSGTTTIEGRLQPYAEIGDRERASAGVSGATTDLVNYVYDWETEAHERRMGEESITDGSVDVKEANKRIQEANRAGQERADRDLDLFIVGVAGKEVNLKPPKSGDLVKWVNKNQKKIDALKEQLSGVTVKDNAGNEATHLDVLKTLHNMTDRSFFLRDKAKRRKAEIEAKADREAQQIASTENPQNNEEELKALMADQAEDDTYVNENGDVANPENQREVDNLEQAGFWDAQNEVETELAPVIVRDQSKLHNSIAPQDEVGNGMPQEELVHELSLVGMQPIPIITHATPESASEATGVKVRKDGRGFALDDQIHLISSNIKNPEVAQRTIFHEGVGHIGIESMLGEKAYNELLDSVVKFRMGDVRSMAESRGFMRNGVHIKQPKIKSLKDAYREGARELVATAAEPFADMKDSVLKRVMRTVGDFLQRIFGGRYSDAYLRSLMSQINHHHRYGKTNEVHTMDINDQSVADPLPSITNSVERAGMPTEEDVSYSTLPSDRPTRELSDEEESQMSHLSENARDIIRRTGGGETRTSPRDYFDSITADWKTRWRQKMFDRYKSLEGLGRRFYVLARMTHSNDSAMNSALQMGKLKWLTREGKFDGLGNDNTGGFFNDLGDKIGSEIYPFLRYVATLRAEKLKGVYSISQELVDTINATKGIPQSTKDAVKSLMGEEYTDKQLLREALGEAGANFRYDDQGNMVMPYGNKISGWSEVKENKERLFSDSDIATLKAELVQGNMADGRSRVDAYEEGRELLHQWNKSFVDIARKSNLISEEEAEIWLKDPYVPFYRIIDENAGKNGYAGPQTVSGLARQTASKRLKGADIPINDLLSNILMNWNHLLSSSLKNQASLEAIDSMIGDNQLGYQVAEKITQAEADAEPNTTTWIRRNGKKENYRINDALIYESMNAMHSSSNTTTQRMLRKFKQWLTWGATVDPAFKVANLIRDTVTSAAVGNTRYGITDILYGNVKRGWGALKEGSDLKAQIEAGGGTINFGQLMDQDAATKLIERGLSRENIIDTPSSRKKFLRKLDRWVGSNSKPYSWYRDIGNKAENVNRAASYMKTLEETGSHLEASFEARDLMDFSNHGSLGAMRFLTDSVPFLNARMQGLYKLGRSYKDPRRKRQLITVAGTYMLADLALHIFNKEDEEYDSREEWDFATYHWIGKLFGDETAFRIPKAFEIGAISTINLRTYDYLVSGFAKEERRLLGRSVVHALTQTFAFNPVPQMFQPVLEVASNKNFFTGRAIEPMFQRGRRRSEDIGSAYTSPTAKSVAGVLNAPRDLAREVGIDWDKSALSLSGPQIQHLVRGYFGWAGWFANAGVDMIYRTATDSPDTPAWTPNDIVLIKRFVQQFPSGQSRHKTLFYENMSELQKVFTAYKEMREDGEMEDAREFFRDNKSNLSKRRTYMKIKKSLDEIRKYRQAVFSSKRLNADQKRRREDSLNRRETRLLGRLMTNPSMHLE